MKITLALKYHSYQIKRDDVISHVTTPQNPLELIAKADIYQLEDNRCSQKEICVKYIEVAINGLAFYKGGYLLEFKMHCNRYLKYLP